ncbi:BTB/POZ domain-containing protein FBL11 isoform X1 [Iris pallida]|uniref:BTB/POZ domain-containing protein FBL11 isoform X1 n=1 Tax=Iris pallida TaxID=29817 RepID=A0AAX6GS01_IRIPA|nr:BTB/POZ domain-containing protein FBL11 isoform X1 [Iris pallida]
MMHDNDGEDHYQILEKLLCILSFENVHEMDVSKCAKVHSGAAIIWLRLAFPSLRILRACHCPRFKIEDLNSLIEKCPFICEVDLTVDLSPVVSAKVPVLSVTVEENQLSNDHPFKKMKERPCPSNISSHTFGSVVLSNISKLTLQGRNEINDWDLLYISTLSNSLSYLNIKGCTLVTDMGISKLICKCRNIHSLILSFTSFGRNSVMTLCSIHTNLDSVHGVHHNHKYSDIMAFRLQQLHIDGCRGIDHKSMSQLMSHTYMLHILRLRDTCVVDDALYEFMGSNLESLDVSETMISAQALTYIIKRNPLLRYVSATSCRNLQKHESNGLASIGGSSSEDLFSELGKNYILEEVALGWGFSSLELEKLKPAIGKLRAITMGLGASLDHHTLSVLPELCPLLESVVLNFQVISDNVVRSILESLKHLQVLSLCCCIGELSMLSFSLSMPMLRTLKLDWVTPSMTNTDLTILTQNCSKLVELSLSGCKLLDSNSQGIISSGWPGLTLIHLEDCGNVTADGVTLLFNCIALEDLLLRHNGRGIGRNFISDAASKLPLLRRIALDLCDACEGGFDSPSHAEGFYLSNVRLSCCMPRKCGFDIEGMKPFKPIHKKTIVLEWNSRELRTTEVEERI